MTARQSIFVIVALAAGIVLSSMVGSHGQADGGAAPTSVAVVDIRRVFENMDEIAAMRAEIRSKQEALTRKEQQRRKAIQQLEADLGLLNPEQEDFQNTREEIKTKLVELRVWKEVNAQSLEAEAGLQLAMAYRRATQEIEQIAQRQGYDLVLFRDDDKEIRGQNQQQVLQQIALHKVLYSNDAIDLTDRVTQQLNNRYNAGR